MQNHLPQKFDFFQFGSVEQRSSSKALEKGAPFSVLFKITGEEHSYCLISFEEKPENEMSESMRIEIANILVSKFLSSMIDETGALLELSPPEVLHPDTKHHLLLLKMVESSSDNILTQNYEYAGSSASHIQSKRIAFKLRYLPSMKGTS